MIRGQLLFTVVFFCVGCATASNCPPLAMLDGIVSVRAPTGAGAQSDSGLAISRGALHLTPSEHLPLHPGDVLSTDAQTFAVVSFAGARVVLKPNTRVKLGSVLADFGEFLVTGWLKLVQTKTVTAKSHGTKYDVKVDQHTGKTTVTVIEGRVTLSPKQEGLGEISIAAGQRVSVAETEARAPAVNTVPKEELNALTAELARVDKPRDALPDVVGLTLDAALVKLAGRGLKQPDDVVVNRRAGHEQLGLVTEQLPVAGAYSNTVTLTVAEQGIPMPNLVGMQRAAAERALQLASLGLGTVNDSFAKDASSALVVAQSPGAGALVLKSTAVELTLASVTRAEDHKAAAAPASSRSVARVRIPDVTGVSPELALGALENAGLKAHVELTYRSDLSSARVLSQDPLPNQMGHAGDLVRLVLVASKGE